MELDGNSNKIGGAAGACGGARGGVVGVVVEVSGRVVAWVFAGCGCFFHLRFIQELNRPDEVPRFWSDVINCAVI